MMNVYHYIFVQTPRMLQHSNCIMIVMCKFIHCNKCTTLLEDTDNCGSYACIGAGSIFKKKNNNLCIIRLMLLWT